MSPHSSFFSRKLCKFQTVLEALSVFETLRSLIRGNNFPNDLSTYGIVSALWLSVNSLGVFIGPSVAGFLYDNFQFRNSTYYVIGSQLFMVSYLR